MTTFDFTTIQAPNASSTEAFGINDAGDIVGFYRGSDGRDHGFVQTVLNHAFVTIDPPGSTDTTPIAINAVQEVIGDYSTSDNHQHGFIDDNGVVTTLDFPGAIGTVVHGINDAGLVVGQYFTGGLTSHGFVYNSATKAFTTLDPTSGADGSATGINDAGQITGWYIDSSDPQNPVQRGYIFDPTTQTFTNLDVPGAFATTPEAINASGEVAGEANLGGEQGFLYDPSKPAGSQFTVVNPFGSDQVSVRGLNDAGQIVGDFTTDKLHAFLFSAGTVSSVPRHAVFGEQRRGSGARDQQCG